MHIEPGKEARELIIGAPLLLVAVFCFGLAIVHPVTSGSAKSASANDAPATKSHVRTTSTPVNASLHELKPLPLVKTGSSGTLSAPAASANESGSVANSTVSPQSGATSRATKNSQGGTTSASSPNISSTNSKNKLHVSSGSWGGGLIDAVSKGILGL